jgi:hypothetical protein
LSHSEYKADPRFSADNRRRYLLKGRIQARLSSSTNSAIEKCIVRRTDPPNWKDRDYINPERFHTHCRTVLEARASMLLELEETVYEQIGKREDLRFWV